MSDLRKETALADKIVTFAEDGVRNLDRAIAGWPAEFRAVMWEAVAQVALSRAREAKNPEQSSA